MGKKKENKPVKREYVDPYAAVRASFGLEQIKETSSEPDYSHYTGDEGKKNKGGGNAGTKNKKDTLIYTAQAPYNFVPLLAEMVPGEIGESDAAAYAEHVRSQGKNTGYLDLTITAKTPLFIGGNGEAFFAPAGTPMLPGSTIRGMVKNIFKIVTAGAMRSGEDVQNRHLYSRGMAAKGSFGAYYSNRMIEMKSVTHDDGKTEQKAFSKAKPGFLIKIKGEGKYFVCPAQGRKAKYEPNDKHRRNELGSVEWGYDKDDYACAIHTGKMQHKTKTGKFEDKWIYYIIFAPDWRTESRIPVPMEVVDDYINDKTRTGLNLLDAAKKDNEAAGYTHCQDVELVVPCCYMAEGGVVQHFGHGQHYRIPYEKSVADHIPRQIADEAQADLADMIFGRKELWGSRVMVENAVLAGSARRLPASLPHPLMSPNPTSFQLYLEQSQDPDAHKINHWDDPATLRGYKLYWHQANDENAWSINSQKDKAVQGMSRIAPLAAGCRFKGRLSFQDLSDVELGALLSVFDLPRTNKNICFKLGMGKPIGMGSVAIDSQLHLLDQRERYHSLFQQKQFATGDALAGKEIWQRYLGAFEAYMQLHIQNKSAYRAMLGELKTMLDYQVIAKGAKWQQKLAYMRIGDNSDKRYRDRAILKKPSHYVL